MVSSVQGCKIVVATRDHAEGLARLARDTYEETFIGVSYYTKELVESYTRGVFTPESMAEDIADPSVRTFLAIIDGRLAAYAKVAERAPGDFPPGVEGLYLGRLYIRAAFKSQGLGSQLLDHCYAEARARSLAKIWLSVWEHNPAAIAFYERRGFRRAGEWDWIFESGGRRYVDLDYLYIRDVP